MISSARVDLNHHQELPPRLYHLSYTANRSSHEDNVNASIAKCKRSCNISQMNDLSTPTDVICVVVPTNRLRADGQPRIMREQGCRSVVEAKGKTWWTTVLRLVRPGTVVKVQRLHLLANPAALRKPGGKYADLIRRIDAVEAKGGSVMDVDRGWLSTRKRDLHAMLEAASISLSQGSREPTGRKAGRPTAAEKFETHRAVIEAEWLSRKHSTNDHAVAAMIARGVPKSMTVNLAWRCMTQWTGSGSSGRAPGPRNR